MEQDTAAASNRRVLPSRSTRGQRLHQLIGEELEADDLFWKQAASIDSSTEEDDDFAVSEASELSSADDAISSTEEAAEVNPLPTDSNTKGTTEEIDEEQEAILKERERLERLKVRKKRYRFGKYEDPALKERESSKRPRSSRSRSTMQSDLDALNSSPKATPDSSEWSVSRESLRRTTKAASEETARLLEERAATKAQRQQERQRRRAEQTPHSGALSQEERLAEALQVTEPANRLELEHLLALADEKDSALKRQARAQRQHPALKTSVMRWFRGYRPQSTGGYCGGSAPDKASSADTVYVEWVAFRQEEDMPMFLRKSQHAPQQMSMPSSSTTER